MNKRIFALMLACLFAIPCLASCKDDTGTEEEVFINDDYASSELMDFEGTVDEIYADGSMLVYSPLFALNFDSKLIVELDENTVVDGFEIKENQHIRFTVYSAIRKDPPLTMVASKLELIAENSTQRQDAEE